jgi:hypothetical protein
MNGFTNLALADQRQAELLQTGHRARSARSARARRREARSMDHTRRNGAGVAAVVALALPADLGDTLACSITSRS